MIGFVRSPPAREARTPLAGAKRDRFTGISCINFRHTSDCIYTTKIV
ncbi:MAG TPA: hypothetical protein VE956_09370 [Nodularia sp. (in: cyanobacteria)]|nr:hypothetical protein [Nodularia sp. (in: cyanobacteria)]